MREHLKRHPGFTPDAENVGQGAKLVKFSDDIRISEVEQTKLGVSLGNEVPNQSTTSSSSDARRIIGLSSIHDSHGDSPCRQRTYTTESLSCSEIPPPRLDFPHLTHTNTSYSNTYNVFQ